MNTIQDKYIYLINELYRSFDFFNGYYCDNKLPKPIITLQGEKRKGKTLGWFGKDFWTEHKEGDEKNKVHELNLTAEALYRDPKQVLETMLHEMAHLKNAVDEIKDVSGNQVHNKNFKKTAEFFGLVVNKMKGKGWAHTSLGEKAEQVIELLQPKTELYKIFRTPPEKINIEPKIINLSVDISYQEKIDYLMSKYGKKRELTESAIDILFEKEKNKEKGTTQ